MRVTSTATSTGPQTFNVRNFGAQGNGVSDDTAAIQACVTAACAAISANSNPQPGVIVYFPTGTYKISSTITAAVGSQGETITFRGESGRGFGSASRGPVQLLMVNTAVDTFQITGTAGNMVAFQGLQFNYSGATAGHAINATPIGGGLSTLQVTDCGFKSVAGSCALVSAGCGLYVDNVAVNDYGRTVAGAVGFGASAGGGAVQVYGSVITTTIATAGDAVDVSGASQVIVVGNIFYVQTNTKGVLVDGSVNGAISDNWFQRGTVHGLFPQKCSIHDNAVTTPIVLTGVGRGCNVHHNQGYNPVGHGVAQPAIAATGVAVFNDSGVDCEVYVAGGTVTAVGVGGVATGLTGGTFRVANGQTITLTYTVAPTWQWFGD